MLFVLDASALIAAIYSEKGANMVREHIDDAFISTVNLTEVAENIISRGVTASDTQKIFNEFSIKVIDYTREQAFIAASLRKPTKSLGLSLGDRACLSLAITKKLPIFTADKIWEKLDIGVEIKLIR